MLSGSGLAGALVCEELAGVFGDLFGRDVGEAGDAGLDGGTCYGCGDVRGDARVERACDDVLLVELCLVDEIGDGLCCGHLHLFIDCLGAYVEGAAEDTREGQQVVDLVRPCP